MFARFGAVVRNIGSLLFEAYREFQRDRAVELGAALAYYTIFSLAPVLVIVIAVAGLAFGREAAQGEILAQFRALVGPEGARALQTIIESANHPRTGLIASVIGIGALLLGASGAFGQLQTSLNRIWNLPPKPSHGWRGIIRQRVLSFALVMAIGFLLLASLIVSAALAALSHWIDRWFPGLQILGFATEVMSFLVITLMFALMYRMLPDIQIAWRDVWIGAAITSVLFSIGKALIGLYVTKTHVGSAYGVAGSLVVVLAWFYYSSQIIFYGAECTQVFAERYGSRRGLTRATPTG
jgi:membrane protein